MKAFYDLIYDNATKKVFEPEPLASTSGGAEDAARGSTSE
jgi:hypothetical protein